MGRGAVVQVPLPPGRDVEIRLVLKDRATGAVVGRRATRGPLADFRDVKRGSYVLEMTAEGYPPRVVDVEVTGPDTIVVHQVRTDQPGRKGRRKRNGK